MRTSSIYKNIALLVAHLLMLFSLLSAVALAETDVTNKIQIVKSPLMYDRSTKTSYLDISIKNISQDILKAPITVVVENVTPTTVSLANTDSSQGGIPYYEYAIPEGYLAPGKSTASRRWVFLNTSNSRFSYSTRVFSVVPAAGAVVGTSGRTIAITDTTNDLYGTQIVIPSNALSNPVAVTVEETDVSSSLDKGTVDAGPAVELGPNGTQFATPLKITIPYDDKDDDGYIDYTDVPEDEVSVKTYDEVAQSWIEIPIASQDLEKKTVTFFTNHFSTYLPTVSSEYQGTDIIFTIDGLKPKMLLPSWITWIIGNDIEPGYLRKAILKMGLGLQRASVVSYSGSADSTKRWDGNPYSTPWMMVDVNNALSMYYNAAKGGETKHKFILVSHSWGTILSMLALKYCDTVAPDLFVTLSCPLGSENAMPPILSPLESVIAGFTETEINATYYALGQPSKKIEDFDFQWLNYWAMGDLISGPLKLSQSTFIEGDISPSNSFRNIITTPLWHAVTSLDQDQMDGALWNSCGDPLFKNVEKNIRYALGPSIKQSPSYGLHGTVFHQDGANFTPDGSATLHFRGPDGSESTAVQHVDHYGKFSISYTVPNDKGSGGYTWWAIDDSSQKKSNELTYTINCPSIDQAPLIGQAGTIFDQNGRYFTPNGFATLYFKAPGGTLSSIQQQIDNAGYFRISYTIPQNKMPGIYTWYAVDGPTGVESNTCTYEVKSESTTPSASTGKIPDTGQTTSYTKTFGEDADYTINPQSYTKLDDSGKDLPDSATSWAMVRDNVTGLIWENKTDDGGIHDKDNSYSWYTAKSVFIAHLNNLKFGGFDDWRLPTVMELSMLVNANMPIPGPTINTVYFQNTMPNLFWSSTTVASYSDYAWAWGVHFYDGTDGCSPKSDVDAGGLYVRAVRGGP